MATNPLLAPNPLDVPASPTGKSLLAQKQAVPPVAPPVTHTPGVPVKPLQPHNVFLPIKDVNTKIQAIVDAHEKATGQKPSPGLVADVLKADPVIQKLGVSYHELFHSPPKTPLSANMLATSTAFQATQGGKSLFAPDQPLQVAYDWKDTPSSPFDKPVYMVKPEMRYVGVGEHDQNIPGLVQTDAPPKSKLYGDVVMHNLSTVYNFHSNGGHSASILGPAAGLLGEATKYVVEHSPTPVQWYWKESGKIASDLLTIEEQLPTGLVQMGNAAVTDFVNPIKQIPAVAKGKKYKETHESTDLLWDMTKATAYSFTPDQLNEHPGFALFNAYGFASGVGGVFARGRLAAAAAPGERLSTFAKKPIPGSVEYGVGPLTETAPLFENVVAATVQKAYLDHKNARLNIRQTVREEDIKTNAIDWLMEEPLFRGRSLSPPERRLRKARETAMELDAAIKMAPVLNINRLMRTDGIAKHVWQGIRYDPATAAEMRQFSKTEELGIQKAITLLFTDDHDPIGTWRTYHQNQIENFGKQHTDLTEAGAEGLDLMPGQFNQKLNETKYNIAAHKAQLDGITAAEKILQSVWDGTASPKMQSVYNAAIDLVDRMTHTQKTLLNLTDRTAEQNIAKTAATLRGERLDYHRDIGHYRIPPGYEDYFTARAAVDKAQKVVENERKKLDTAEKNLTKPTTKGNVGDRPKRAEAVAQQREALARAEAFHASLHGPFSRLAEPTLEPLSKKITGREDYVRVYHGSDHVIHGDLRPSLNPEDPGSLGKGIYFSDDTNRASHYSSYYSEDASAPNVTVHMVDRSTLFNLHERDQERLDNIKESLLQVLPPNVAEDFDRLWATAKSRGESVTQDRKVLPASNSGEWLRRELVEAFNKNGEDGPVAANNALQDIGFTGLRYADEHVIFDPADLLTPHVTDPTKALRQLREGVGSAYQPFRREIYREPGKFSRFNPRSSKYGLKPVGKLDNMRMNTGAAVQIGDFRWDTTKLLGETYAQVVKAAQGVTLHNQLWALAGGEQLSTRHQPIRDIQDAPEHLKQVVAVLEREQVDPGEAALLTDKSMQDLYAFLYPPKAEIEQILKEGGHVKWVDESLAVERIGFDQNTWRAVDQVLGSVMALPNEVWRLNLIFATPAYALNALGSAALLLTKQGFLAPVNYARAFQSPRLWGNEVTSMFDAIGGDTHAMSYLPSVEGKMSFTAGSRAFANAWQKVTDTHFRRAAVIYELRRRGLLKDGDTPEIVKERLLSDDPETKKLITETRHAARKAMLDFNTITWPERAIMRHLFFIYSFMRASAAYSIHYLIEHPIQGAVLNAAAEDRQDMIKRLVGDVPDWFLHSGYVPVSPNTVINPVQINMPAAINQIAYPLQSFLSDVPYSSPEDLMGGFSTLAQGIVTGKDSSTGRDLPNAPRFFPFHTGTVARSFWSMAAHTPVGYAFERGDKAAKQQPLPPPAVSASPTNPILAALAQERAAMKQTPFEAEGFMGTWGPTIFRSALPKKTNRARLEAAYWADKRDSDPEAFAKHELDSVLNGLIPEQEKAVNMKAPQEVKDAVTLIGKWTQHMRAWTTSFNVPDKPNERMKFEETLKFLRSEDKITEKQAAAMRKDITPDLSDGEVRLRETAALWFSGAKPWQQWVEHVDNVDWYNHSGYATSVKRLEQDGFGDYSTTLNAPAATRWKYGRMATAFAVQYDKRKKAVNALEPGFEQKHALADLRTYENAHTDPVTIDGQTFPPLIAVASSTSYSRLTSTERAQWTIDRATRNYGSLSDYEKTALTGEQPDKSADLGWNTLARWLDEQHKTLPIGKNLPTGTYKAYGDDIAKKLPSFKKEWDFAQQPLAVRMESYSPIKNSPYSDSWSKLLSGVGSYAQQAYKSGWKPAKLAASWKSAQEEKVKEWIAEQPVGFQAEVKQYIDANPQFLTKLVKP